MATLCFSNKKKTGFGSFSCSSISYFQTKNVSTTKKNLSNWCGDQSSRLKICMPPSIGRLRKLRVTPGFFPDEIRELSGFRLSNQKKSNRTIRTEGARLKPEENVID